MDAILGSLPQLVDIVQKGGVVGVLLIVICVLGYEVRRLRNLLPKIYRQRDKARLRGERYKSACLSHSIAVDVSDIDAIFNEEEDD